jgi:hypothetical protein
MVTPAVYSRTDYEKIIGGLPPLAKYISLTSLLQMSLPSAVVGRPVTRRSIISVYSGATWRSFDDSRQSANIQQGLHYGGQTAMELE